MKSIAEQLANKCIHFTGLINKTCKADVKYDDVKTGRPMELPCFNRGGDCDKAVFRTEEQANKEAEEIEGRSNKTLIAFVKAKKHYQETGELSGSIECECGGQLKYSVAQSNGHIWAKCSTCGIGFIE